MRVVNNYLKYHMCGQSIGSYLSLLYLLCEVVLSGIKLLMDVETCKLKFHNMFIYFEFSIITNDMKKR
jgi:hypothetical protein